MYDINQRGLRNLGRFDDKTPKIEFFTTDYNDADDYMYKLSKSGTIAMVDINSDDQLLGYMFELIYTLIILDKNQIEHGDLNAGNISGRRVDYERRYSINEVEYVISTPIMPIIIDWAEPTGNLKSKLKDLQHFPGAIFQYYGIDFDPSLKQLLSKADYEVIFSPVFSRFLFENREVKSDEGKKMKIFDNFVF